MISVIIPVYNQAEKLVNCLESINKQNWKDIEIIIVNDGSKDDIQPIIDKYILLFQGKFRYLIQENKGAPAARNAGFKVSQGDYIIFTDADIIMKPEMLAEMHKTLQENPEASYAYCSHLFGIKRFPLFPFSAEKLKQMPYIHSTSLIRRSDFPLAGWDESVQRLQDWDLWLTMLENGKTGVWINKYLFHIDSGGTMSKWLPGVVYKIMPFLPAVKKYKQAVKNIKQKHNLA